MKFIKLSLAFLCASVAMAAPTNVQKDGAAQELTAGFATGNKTITISSGGSLVAASGSTVTLPAGSVNATALTGQVALANGGTGAALADPNADRLMFWDDSATSTAYLTAGSGLSISGTTISTTDAGGTVTSVGLSLPSIITVTNSPVTTTGTLTGTLATQTAGTVFAGPVTGSAAAPTFKPVGSLIFTQPPLYPLTETEVNFVFEGDSITAGNHVTPTTTYPYLCQAQPFFSGRTPTVNVATPANTLADITSQYTSEVYPYSPEVTGEPLAYLFVYIGTNDYRTIASATWLTSWESYVAQAQADGFTVVAFTVTGRTDDTEAQNNTLIAYNTGIKAAVGLWAYLVDVNELLPDHNSTVWYSDGTHPTEDGNEKIAALINFVMNSNYYEGPYAGGTPTFTNVTANSGAFISTRLTAAGSAGFRTKAIADSNYRLDINADGKIEWGSGSAVIDTNLYRSAASVLETDDTFSPALLRVTKATAAGSSAISTRQTGDANFRFNLDADGKQEWGSGSGSRDTFLTRTATATLSVTASTASSSTTTGALVVTGGLGVGGAINIGTPLSLNSGGTGVALADPNADRIMFWDDSAGATAYLTVGSGLTITGTTLTNDVSTPVSVANGGTGQSSYTDGQLLIGNTTGNTLARAALTGTANQVVVTNGSGTITLSTPQSIGTGSSPTFAATTLTTGLNLGTGTALSTEHIRDIVTANAGQAWSLNNDNAGVSARATIEVGNGSGSSTNALVIRTNGTGFTTSGVNTSDGGSVGTGSGLTGGFSIYTLAAAPINYFINNSAVGSWTSSGVFNVSTTTDSSSTTTGASTISGGLGVAKTVTALHYSGGGSTPGIAAGAGAGTGPTVSITGTDTAGEITVTTGTLPAVNSVIATITFSSTYGTAPYVVLWPAEANSSALGFLPYVTSTATTFSVNNAVSLGVIGSTTYKYNFHVIK